MVLKSGLFNLVFKSLDTWYITPNLSWALINFFSISWILNFEYKRSKNSESLTLLKSLKPVSLLEFRKPIWTPVLHFKSQKWSENNRSLSPVFLKFIWPKIWDSHFFKIVQWLYKMPLARPPNTQRPGGKGCKLCLGTYKVLIKKVAT